MEIAMQAGQVPQVPAQPKEMLSVRLDESIGTLKVRINFSSLAVMQECWRKVEYSLLRGLRSQFESPATLFGTAIHKALEVYYSAPRTARNLPEAFDETMRAIGVGQWQDSWANEVVFLAAQAFVLKAAPLAALPAENKHSVVTGVWLLTHYFQRYVTDPFVVLHDKEGPVVERRFSLPLGSFKHNHQHIDVELFGQIDAVLINEQTEQVLVADHKTTGQLYGFYDRVKPNHQYTAYLLGARDVLGIASNGFLVNAIEKKAIPKTARGTPPQFARQITTRTEDDFNELRSAIFHAVETFLRLRDQGHWPQTAPGPCGNYGGCPYLEVCAAPKELHETVIKAKYQETGAHT